MASRKMVLLLAIGAVAALAGVSLTVATASGWVAVAPEPLPLTSFAPRPGEPSDAFATLDHGEFEVAGSRFAGEMTGAALATGGAHYQARVQRVDGDASGRLEAVSWTVRDETGRVREAASPAIAEDGSLSMLVDVPLEPGNHTLTGELHLRAFRDAALGAWRLDDVVLVFTAQVEARAA